jgi:hypothetical protein
MAAKKSLNEPICYCIVGAIKLMAQLDLAQAPTNESIPQKL